MEPYHLQHKGRRASQQYPLRRRITAIEPPSTPVVNPAARQRWSDPSPRVPLRFNSSCRHVDGAGDEEVEIDDGVDDSEIGSVTSSLESNSSLPPNPPAQASHIFDVLFDILVYSILLALVLLTLNLILQPPYIPLPIHQPLLRHLHSLQSLSLPEVTQTTGDLFGLTMSIKNTCRCPLAWSKHQRRFNPQAPGELWDEELWGEATAEIPGAIGGLDEASMGFLGASCELAIQQTDVLQQAVKIVDGLIREARRGYFELITGLLQDLHRIHNTKGGSEASTTRPWRVIQIYLMSLEKLQLHHTTTQKSVLDAHLAPGKDGKGQHHRRKNWRAYVTEKVTSYEDRLQLASTVILAAHLSNISDSSVTLQENVIQLASHLEGLLDDPKNVECATFDDKIMPDHTFFLSRLHNAYAYHAKELHESLQRLDALRASLHGFLQIFASAEEAVLRNSHLGQTPFVDGEDWSNDVWGATWAWTGLHGLVSEGRTSYSTWFSSWLTSLLPRWLRTPLRLPAIANQHGAFILAIDGLAASSTTAPDQWMNLDTAWWHTLSEFV
ncbi:hypothetical protein G7046_g6773 [Stylonectria norvegica]|nr:hypothetical protein G7046_g6773 [Stylonectria norvegica]